MRKTLAKRTEVCWGENGQTFANLSSQEVVALTGDIANLIGIRSSHIEKIRIIFGDHYYLDFPDGTKHTNLAFCAGAVDPTSGEYTECIVVINRSLELAQYSLKNGATRNKHLRKRFKKFDVIDDSTPDDPILCHFSSPKEMVIWLIAEELKHAHVNLVAKSSEKSKQWNNNYANFLRKRGFKTSELYSVNLDEITASRSALRILEYFSEGDRKIYFRELYLQSLRLRRCVQPVFLRSAFTPTGFKPDSPVQVFFARAMALSRIFAD